jgi:hypothetical protein
MLRVGCKSLCKLVEFNHLENKLEKFEDELEQDEI